MNTAELHRLPHQSPPADVFSLPADRFIDAWAMALGLTDEELPSEDRHNLATAIRSGTSRLRVLEAMKGRRGEAPRQVTEDFSLNAVRRVPDRYALIENFTRFSPENDAAFLRYAFAQICGHEPTTTERLGLEFDLRRGAITRAEAIRRIVDEARRAGLTSVWDSLEDEAIVEKAVRDRDFACARVLPVGFVVDSGGGEALVFVRQLENQSWMVGPDLLDQSLDIIDKGWNVRPGWLITGPKRSLAPGAWQVCLDLLQRDDAELDVEVVANSGLDVLHSITVAGPVSANFCIEIGDHHKFIELRVRIHDTDGDGRWLCPREISMRRCS